MTLLNSPLNADPRARQDVIRLGEQALVLSPTRPQIYYGMGQAAFALGRGEAGIGYFRAALALNGRLAESHWNLALLLADRKDEARTEFALMQREHMLEGIDTESLRQVIDICQQRDFLPEAATLRRVLLKR